MIANMLTKSDLKLIKELVDNSRIELKEDIVKFKDEILHEIISLRDEVTIVVGYRGMLEDHETRLDKLETRFS